ncbi:MAG: enoyl-CoA hydratase/isomerase family protein [Chloroflexi bacterium]|nr:enoyl-CoA hydratase/isomerase family protein [Chloroflexota bacterium]
MSDYKYLQVRREGPVVIATMINPPRNLLNAAMVEELHALVDGLSADADARVLVLTGGADGIFITHYDVGELSAISDLVRSRAAPEASAETAEAPRQRELHALNRLSLKLAALPQPVIAAINGTAMGGGCELSLACDFRIMARRGVIGLPEVRVGILPGAGGTQRMTRLIGSAKALELMLLGEAVDADTAAALGLVHRAVDPDALMPEVLRMANELASRPRQAVALIKACVQQALEPRPLEERLAFESERFMELMRSEDASRLMKAYLTSERPLNEL